MNKFFVAARFGKYGTPSMTDVSATNTNTSLSTGTTGRNGSRTITINNRTVMRLNRTWNVECPPANITMLGGATGSNQQQDKNNNLTTTTTTTMVVLPTPKSAFTLGGRLMRSRNKRYRLAIEIHGPEETTNHHTTTHTTTSTINNKNNNTVRPKRGLTRADRTMSEVLQLSKELLDDEKIIVRILKPRNVRAISTDRKDKKNNNIIINNSDSSIESWGDSWSKSDIDDEEEVPLLPASSSSSSSQQKGTTAQDTVHGVNDHDHTGWVEYRKYEMDEIVQEELIGRNKTIIVATMGLGALQERREFKFDSADQAQEFWTEWQQLKVLVKERTELRLVAFRQSQRDSNKLNTNNNIKNNDEMKENNVPKTSMLVLTPQDEIHLLIEIVSATDLPVSDDHNHNRRSIDPYTLVYLGQKEIHRTHHIAKTHNPIWTVETGCFCLFSTSAPSFFQASDGLTFLIKDKDSLGLLKSTGDGEVGRVSVAQSTLLQLTGEERVALPLKILKAPKYHSAKNTSNIRSHTSSSRRNDRENGPVVGGVFAPTLYIRVRHATPNDRQFMKHLCAERKKKTMGVYANEAFVAPHRDRVHLLKRESKVVDGVRRYRVKPHPDPDRPEQETKWISSEMLLGEVMKPTHHWVEAGSGILGKLYLEILKCDGLPKMDAGLDGKADAFCCIIYEDAIVNTDVINDTCKPRWVPWCQRGFCFRMAHPSSQVLIGVFDYDSESNVTFDSHDPIGRISIDVTNFRPDTEYVLTYDLYRSVLDTERSTFGTLTVRLRLEYHSYRDFVRGSLQLPPVNFINLPQKHAFKTSYFVIHGEENLERFDMHAINAYRSELEGYHVVLYYLKKAAISLVLWRGHFEVRRGNYIVQLPLHSAVAFCMGVTLIENLNLIPSYFLFSIAWLLLASNEVLQKHPSPWHGSLSYMELWYAVLVNHVPPIDIEAYENEGTTRAYEEEMKNRQDEEVARGHERRERLKKIEAMFEEERNSAAEAFQPEDIATKLRGPSVLSLVAKALLPIQRMLGQFCIALRIASSIVLWNESVYSFIIVNACLTMGVILLWFPWSFILRWSVRIAIWVFLGPWMKLFDIFYVRKQAQGGLDEAVLFQKLFDERLQAFLATRDVLFRAKEDILKKRDMKRFMFGHFVARVPQLKEYRYSDVPRAESFARPIKSPPKIVVARRSHGQTLVGQMIPRWGDVVDHDKLAGMTTKKTAEANSTQSKKRQQDAWPEPETVLLDDTKKFH